MVIDHQCAKIASSREFDSLRTAKCLKLGFRNPNESSYVNIRTISTISKECALHTLQEFLPGFVLLWAWVPKIFTWDIGLDVENL
jgi:hypothetical protein